MHEVLCHDFSMFDWYELCIKFFCLVCIGSSQTAYKAVINDTTLPSTPLFTVNVMGATSYSIAGEMSDGFTVDMQSGMASTTRQLDIGRYEFIITVIVFLESTHDISFIVGLVDVLSTSK